METRSLARSTYAFMSEASLQFDRDKDGLEMDVRPSVFQTAEGGLQACS